jgi:hypothetical protein
MKSLYEKRIKKLEDENLALIKTTKNLKVRIWWTSIILLIIAVSVLIEEIF